MGHLTSVRTYDEFVTWRQRELDALAAQPAALMRFSVECAAFLLDHCRAVLGEELTAAECAVAERMLGALGAAAADDPPTLLSAADAETMVGELASLGPEDDIEQLNLDCRVGYCLECLCTAVDCCREPSVELASRASDTIMDALDYEADEADDGFGATAGAPFLYPTFRREWERQKELLARLRA